MSIALTFVAYVICLVVMATMYFDHKRGQVELFSLRNVALTGFVMFVVISAPVALDARMAGPYALQQPTKTMAVYLVWCVVFLVVLMGVYRSGFLAARLSRWVPDPGGVPGTASLWVLAIVFTILAAPMRYSVSIPYVGILTEWMSTAMCAVSAGIMGWILGPRFFNPAVLIPAAAIIVVNAAIAQVGEFSRRPLVSIGAAVGWGMYYSYARALPVSNIAFRLAIIGAPGLFAFGLYSSVRTQDAVESGRIIQLLTQRGDAADGLSEISTQNTPTVAMWLYEYRNRNDYAHRHLFTITYFLMYPVPRQLFPYFGWEKPYPISTMTADLAKRKGVQLGPTGITNPVGIVGNAFVEGGFYALIVYAVVGGVMFRFYDETLRRYIYHPFVVLPIGSALGQTLGLARGETGVFAYILVFSSISMTITMFACSKLLGRTMPTLADYDEEDAENFEDPYLEGEQAWVEYGEDEAA